MKGNSDLMVNKDTIITPTPNEALLEHKEKRWRQKLP